MTNKLVRILVCMMLGLAATQASAQTQLFGVEYGLLSLSDQRTSAAIGMIANPAEDGTSALQALADTLIFGQKSGWGQRRVSAYRFRDPNPNVVLPQAFRRPPQVRLGFSFRF